MQSGKLRGVRFAEIVHHAYQAHGPITPDAEYDSESLVDSVFCANALLTESAELIARGKDGRQEVISAITMVVVRLAQDLEPSNTLKSFIVDLVQRIVDLGEIGGAISLSGHDRDELYRHAQWARARIDDDVYAILDRQLKLYKM